jgi:hypothetical protein
MKDKNQAVKHKELTTPASVNSEKLMESVSQHLVISSYPKAEQLMQHIETLFGRRS